MDNISMYRERIGCSIDELAEELWCIATPSSKTRRSFFRVKEPETLRKEDF